MRNGEELEILIAAQVDLAEAQAIDPEKIRAKVEAILTIVIT